MIISIRGTNGSGKSTLVRKLLQDFGGSPKFGRLGPKQPEAYSLSIPEVARPVHVLGPYITPTGGCDRIQPYDLILDLIVHYAGKGHVVFEGVLVGSSYGCVGRLMEQWGQQAVMAFMETPLEVCLENVQKRRNARAATKEFDPTNATSKFNSIAKSRPAMEAAGKVRVVGLSMENGPEQVLALLREAT